MLNQSKLPTPMTRAISGSWDWSLGRFLLLETKPFNSFQSFSSFFFDIFNVVSEMSYSGARVIYQNTRAGSCLANHKSEITDCDRLTTRFWDIHSQRRRSLATKTENNLTICWRQAWTSWAGLGDTKADNPLWMIWRGREWSIRRKC